LRKATRWLYGSKWVDSELQLYNLRHVQEHAAQLGLFLGQQAGKSTRWAPQAQ
jgi:hypothetical protein